ncbi:hypothetical protein pb186bvf_016065 [Paramecium bursaria]
MHKQNYLNKIFIQQQQLFSFFKPKLKIKNQSSFSNVVSDDKKVEMTFNLRFLIFYDCQIATRYQIWKKEKKKNMFYWRKENTLLY